MLLPSHVQAQWLRLNVASAVLSHQSQTHPDGAVSAGILNKGRVHLYRVCLGFRVCPGVCCCRFFVFSFRRVEAVVRSADGTPFVYFLVAYSPPALRLSVLLGRHVLFDLLTGLAQLHHGSL